MEARKLKELYKLLDVKEYEEKTYFKEIDSAKLSHIYDKLKSELDIKRTIMYLDLIIEEFNCKIDDNLVEDLLSDDELEEYVSSVEKTNSKLITALKKSSESENVEVLEDEEIDIFKEDMEQYPIYTDSEEKRAFKKYTRLRRSIDKYIEYNKPFRLYVEQVDKEKKEKEKSKTNDPYITRALSLLYSEYRDSEGIRLLKSDKNFVNLLSKCKEVRDDIFYHNIRLAKSISRKYVDFGLPLNDLNQEAEIGLLRAIEKFEYRKGFKFSTYGSSWIRQSVTRALADDGNIIRIPVHQIEKLNSIRRAERILRNNENIEDPTDEQVLEKLREMGYDYTLSQVKERNKIEKFKQTASTDQAVGEDEDNSLIDFITSESDTKTEEYAEKNDLKEKFEEVLNGIASGTIGKRESNVPSMFSLINALMNDGNVITLILSQKEIREFKLITNTGGKAGFRDEFLKRYGIDLYDSKATNIRPYVISSNERKALVYRYRYNVRNEKANRFLELRNFNEYLFDKELNEDGELTLEKTGKVFGVTRERIRQIESKVKKEVEKAMGHKAPTEYLTINIRIGEPLENIYRLFRINNINDYIVIIKPNPHVSVDLNGNLVPLSEGKIIVKLKNTINDNTKELTVCVKKQLKEIVDDIHLPKPKGLILKKEENKKDSQ